LFESEGRHADLLKTLNLKLNRVRTPAERARHLLRMGRICEEHLRQDEKALGYYKKSLEAHGEGNEASLAVERCLMRLGRFDEFATFLQEHIKKVSDSHEIAQAHLRLGEVLELRLAKLPAATSAYEAALKDEPGLVQAHDALIRVLEQRADNDKVVLALESR